MASYNHQLGIPRETEQIELDNVLYLVEYGRYGKDLGDGITQRLPLK